MEPKLARRPGNPYLLQCLEQALLVLDLPIDGLESLQDDQPPKIAAIGDLSGEAVVLRLECGYESLIFWALDERCVGHPAHQPQCSIADLREN